MDKATFESSWNYFRTVNGVGLRVVEALPKDQLDAHPIPGMRSPKELVVHMYRMIRDLTKAVIDGEAIDSTPLEAEAVARIRTRDELLSFCRESWKAGAQHAAQVTEAQLNGTVRTPWGHPHSGAIMVQALYDEYWHHRGQLYCYLRLLGGSPPSLYDTKHNEPAFQESPVS